MKLTVHDICALVAGLAVTTSVAGQVIRVGPDCTINSIQQAVSGIDPGGNAIIRAQSGTYNENVLISNRQITLIGGHADCETDAIDGRSTVDGSSAELPALRFQVVAGEGEGARRLDLENFILTGGTDANTFHRAGGLSVFTAGDNQAFVILDNTRIRDNESRRQGGGIALRGGGVLNLFGDSRITGNRVTGEEPRGGGLYCEGEYEIQIFGGLVADNTAGSEGDHNGRGGGIHLNGCDLTWHAQGANEGAGALRNNTVHGRGGGLSAVGGAEVLLVGAHSGGTPSTRPLRIHGNRALGIGGAIGNGGGAIYAHGPQTGVFADRSWIYDNHADDRGGVVFIRERARVFVARDHGICHHPRKCSRVFNNTAGGHGSVGFVWGSTAGPSGLFVRNTSVENNGGESNSLFRVMEAELELTDSLLYGGSSPTNAVFARGLGGLESSVNVERSTIADVNPGLAVFNLDGSGGGGVSLSLSGSIIHEINDSAIVRAVTAVSSHSLEVDCVIWHDGEVAELPDATITRTQIADPRFLDREAGRYYLQSDSPAVNYCDGTSSVDLDWSPRGIAHSGRPERFGPFDLGAYELPLAVFSDHFEN